MTCRWDSDAGEYLVDGEICRTDEYGDPTTHCTSRRTCSNHVGHGEKTCARCIGRTRMDLRRIVELAPLAMVQALGVGVDSEAAMLAGPAADQRVFEARRAISRAWIYVHIQQSARGWCEDPDCPRRHFKTPGGDRWHKRGIENALADLLEDDDGFHPYVVLTRWHLMLAEDYGHPLPDRMTVTDSGAYLERTLGRMAQDEEQDFPLFAREIRSCRNHLDAVLRNSSAPIKGAPCPSCGPPAARLTQHFGHWCDDEDCTKIHYPQDPDMWICPRDKTHRWEEDDYRKWVADVYEANKVGA